MGHLINPVSTRLGLSSFWISNWMIVSALSYSYHIMIDNFIISLVEFLFSDSKIVRSFSRIGFFFSHFRFIRRGRNKVHLRLFFALKSSMALPDSFVERFDRNNFFRIVSMQFAKLSKHLVFQLQKRYVSKTENMTFLNLVKTGAALADFRALRSIQRLRFYKNYSQKRKKTRFRFALRKLISHVKGQTLKANRFQKKRKFLKIAKHPLRSLKGCFTRRQGKVVSDNLERLVLMSSTQALSSNFQKFPTLKPFVLFRHSAPSEAAKRMLRSSSDGSLLFSIKTLLVSKLKILYQRFLAKSFFVKLRRLLATNKFTHYLSFIYSSFLTTYINSSQVFMANRGPLTVSATLYVLRQFKLLNPQFLARFVAKRLSYGMPLSYVLSPVISDLVKHVNNSTKFLKGFRIKCSGRFNRTQMASVTVERSGLLSLSGFSNTIGYGYATAFLRYGSCGIKVWLFSEHSAIKNSYFDFNKFVKLKLFNLFSKTKILKLGNKKLISTTVAKKNSGFFLFRTLLFNRFSSTLILNFLFGALIKNNCDNVVNLARDSFNFYDVFFIRFAAWFIKRTTLKLKKLKNVFSRT